MILLKKQNIGQLNLGAQGARTTTRTHSTAQITNKSKSVKQRINKDSHNIIFNILIKKSPPWKQKRKNIKLQ